MTKVDIIQMMKDAWARALMDEKDLREDMADAYAAWVQGLIQKATLELSGVQQAQGQSEGGAQEGAAPPEGGAPEMAAPAEGEMPQ